MQLLREAAASLGLQVCLPPCSFPGLQVDEFFRQWGSDFLHGPDGHMWREWCALSFVQQPWLDPTFKVRGQRLLHWHVCYYYAVAMCGYAGAAIAVRLDV